MIRRREGVAADPKFVVEVVADPAEVTRTRERHALARQNTNWLQSHREDVLPRALGKFLAVAGQEAFVAETFQEAWSRAKAAHPEDTGALIQYVRPEQGPRIYAHHR